MLKSIHHTTRRSVESSSSSTVGVSSVNMPTQVPVAQTHSHTLACMCLVYNIILFTHIRRRNTSQINFPSAHFVLHAVPHSSAPTPINYTHTANNQAHADAKNMPQSDRPTFSRSTPQFHIRRRPATCPFAFTPVCLYGMAVCPCAPVCYV